jgi:hypothetical protein
VGICGVRPTADTSKRGNRSLTISPAKKKQNHNNNHERTDTMSNTKNIQDLMEEMSRGKQTAQYVFEMTDDKRLRAVPRNQAKDNNAPTFSVDDMKVS